ESIASGWFADIAYKRGYLKADANNDGKLSDEERKNIYSTLYGTYTYAVRNNNVEQIDIGFYGNYMRLEDNFEHITKQSISKSESLEEEFNKTLEKDSDFNGEILVKDISSRDDIITTIKQLINNEKSPAHALGDDKPFFSIPSTSSLFAGLPRTKTKKELLEELKKLLEEKRLEQEALEKAKKELEKTAEIDIKHSNDQSLDKNLEKIENLKSQN
ncbi:hypothetical protein DMB92_09170, partial [Campylobacter sp. MIT 99-7217]|uniref:hypothetical protein n=1 Tax=Campylobacter sp. MIT 99-7217 TaxID=535091 RepID=UPI00163C2EA3